jgi:hypothetical protein
MNRIFKKGWFILGGVILLWTVLWFMITRKINNSTVFLIIGYCLLINYALITVVYWTVQRLKKEWEIKD